MKAAWIALAIALLVGLPTVSIGLPATVPQIPTPPTNLTSCGSWPTSVCLRWTGGTGSPLINNTVYFGLTCSSVTGVSTGLQGVSGSPFFYNLTGLHPSTTYCLWVTDWSQVGQSNPSSQLMVSTSSAPLGAQGSPITRDLITIWNNASVPTGTYQQLIVVDSARLSQQIDSNWSNVAFAYRNGTPIFAWLESNASTASHSTYVWLKLNSIPATSSIVIEMDCYAWSVQKSNVNGPTGKAPQLTSTYGEEDDGWKVFTFYENFSGAGSVKPGWINDGAPYVWNNGITMPAGGWQDGWHHSSFLVSVNDTLEAMFNSTGAGVGPYFNVGTGLNGANPPGQAVDFEFRYQDSGKNYALEGNAGQTGSTPSNTAVPNVWLTMSGTIRSTLTVYVNDSQLVLSQTTNSIYSDFSTSGRQLHFGACCNGGQTVLLRWLVDRYAPIAMPPYTLAYSLPDSPSSVSASRIAPSTSLVRWSNPVIDPSAPAKNTLVNDTILYGSNPAILDHRASVGVATSATIGNLTPGARTWFSVQAWNQNGASIVTDPVPDSGAPPPVSSTTAAAAPSIPIFWWLVFGLAFFAILGSFVLVLAVTRRDRDDQV